MPEQNKLGYVAWFEVAQTIRCLRRDRGYISPPEIVRAAALAAVNTKTREDAIDAIDSLFRTHEIPLDGLWAWAA